MANRNRRQRQQGSQQNTTKAAPQMQTIGGSGLKQFSGVIREEFLRELQGRRGARVYREMRDNDPVVGAVLRAIEMLLRGVKWSVAPIDETPQDEDAALFVEDALFDQMEGSFDDLVADILSFLPFGWSLFEIVYRRAGNAVVWQEFAPRSQETLLRWVFSDNGRVEAMVQALPGGKRVEIPLDKALLFRTTTEKGNPEGRSLLRNAYRSWYSKRNIETFEGIGVERDLAGLPVIYVPASWTYSTASASEAALFEEAKNIVRNVRRDEQEGIVLPDIRDDNGNRMLEISLLSTGGRRQFDTNAIVRRYDQRIAMTVLADFILLGHDKVGSYSLSSDKTDLFAASLGAYLSMIAAQFNHKAIPSLLALNGISGRCELQHSDIEKPELDRVSGFVEAMVGNGVIIPDEGIEDRMRELGGLPPRVGDRQDAMPDMEDDEPE